ncbi:hypothetical protein DS745_22540 [Anaerobacillus alkaliphilus]|uniref:Uncharacterized protein n=1 Tax=Anaerobacillus alkaliphilus TaxID=1548597 RepID=A0A4Q0VMA6_9BACI|nr:hypothetical protein [Anaerobacillus alkaliphilus]RXI96491.1 hypothetical protein DS745_22540 [Anaerobacillus alkaliphilus]
MELISRVVLHIETFFLLSHISKIIIQWTLTALAVYAIVTIFTKRLDQTRASLYVGFAVRFVLLIGLSIEMLHQVQITEIFSLYYDRQPSMRQFLHFLFFGYIIVVGFYYIITMKVKKYKGLFYTFDLAVLTLPAIQLVTSILFYFIKESIYLPDLIAILVISSIITSSLYLFFRNYWEIRLKTVIPFYLIVGSTLGLLLLVNPGNLAILEVTNLIIFLGLLMTYHIISKSETIDQYRSSFIGIMAAIFLLLVNPVYNLADAALKNTIAEVQLTYYESSNLVQLEEAKTLARTITGDQDFLFQQPETQDFHNRYWLRSQNYSVDIDGVSGKVMNLHRQTDPVGEKLDADEYVALSKQVLTNMGRTLLDDEQIHVEVREQEGQTIVEMIPRFSDGTIAKQVWQKTSFRWEKESLMEFHESKILYPVESLKDVLLTSDDIHRILQEWYDLLDQEMPAYVLDNAWYGYSNRTIDLYIETAINHSFHLDGRTGEILYFAGDLNENTDFEELEKRILSKLELHPEKWERHRYSNFWDWREVGADPSKRSFYHQFGYTKGEPLFMYSKLINYYSRPSTDVKVASSNEAYEIVNPTFDFIPYASRSKLAHVIDEDGMIREAWLLVIQPFGKANHRLYLVDLETKEVLSLYE